MFTNVRGVKIRECEETLQKDNFSEKKFEMEYKDHEYLHQMIFLDFLMINIKELGRQWIFVVKNDDYGEHVRAYAEIARTIYEKIRDYFIRTYHYMPDFVLVDDEAMAYGKVSV